MRAVQIAKDQYQIVWPSDKHKYIYVNFWRLTGYGIIPYALVSNKIDINFKQKKVHVK
jgi:hypothetical protein